MIAWRYDGTFAPFPQFALFQRHGPLACEASHKVSRAHDGTLPRKYDGPALVLPKTNQRVES